MKTSSSSFRSLAVLTAALVGLHVYAADRFVSLTGGHVTPFTNWVDAATNIQTAIDAAYAGETVWVTNGVYATGGKAKDRDLTNRVALDKPLTVQSINGPRVTIVQGVWDSVSTNGPGAVRCAWVTNGAMLKGFTLTRGATRGAMDSWLGRGGGVWCVSSSNSVVVNCLIISNTAYWNGGGSKLGFLINCAIVDNRVTAGSSMAGGSFGGKLVNCTITGNSAATVGGGQQDADLTNCIIYYNTVRAAGFEFYADNGGGSAVYCCSPNLTVGAGGSITNEPQLVDGYHLAVTSPCRSAGTNISIGTDLEGEAWANPPSIGCDEIWETGITGSLAVAASALWPAVAEKGLLPLNGQVTGWASRVGWDFGDGSILTNASLLNTSHIWTNAGDFTVTFTAFNTDNPGGVSTNLLVHVVPLEAPVITPGGLSGTNFSLSFPGQPGVTYVVQQATNLAAPVTWQTVSTISSTGSVMQITDKKATNDMRFYRVKGP